MNELIQNRRFPLSDWEKAVEQGWTIQGYWHWVDVQLHLEKIRELQEKIRELQEKIHE